MLSYFDLDAVSYASPIFELPALPSFPNLERAESLTDMFRPIVATKKAQPTQSFLGTPESYCSVKNSPFTMEAPQSMKRSPSPSPQFSMKDCDEEIAVKSPSASVLEYRRTKEKYYRALQQQQKQSQQQQQKQSQQLQQQQNPLRFRSTSVPNYRPFVEPSVIPYVQSDPIAIPARRRSDDLSVRRRGVKSEEIRRRVPAWDEEVEEDEEYSEPSDNLASDEVDELGQSLFFQMEL